MPERLSFAHPEFRGLIGVARRDITPPIGIYARNWGAAVHDRAEGIHRPLTATVLTMREAADSPPLVLAALDLGWWRSASDELALRGGLLDALGLDPSNVMISLTHTHAGPSICLEDADRPGGSLVPEYLTSLRSNLIDATREAIGNAEIATLTWATGRCGLAANRDLPDPNAPRRVCGFNPGAPADDTLLVGRVAALDGRVTATLVNYACHPTTLAWRNRLISPDFVGEMREVVEGGADGAPCLFLQGASGDLAPREQYTDDTSLADAHGRELGYAVLSAMGGMLPPEKRLEYSGVVESGAPLAIWERNLRAPATRIRTSLTTVDLPLKPVPPAEELDRLIAECADRVEAERLLRKRRIVQNLTADRQAPRRLWVWTIGDAVLVGHPNEAYSQLQKELRRRYPNNAVIVMNVVNGHFGYLPPADLFDEDIYPVWQSPFDRGCLERLIETCASTIDDMVGTT